MLAERLGERPGEPDQRRLAHDVGQEVGGRRSPHRVRGDEHDPAEAALGHPGGERLAQPQRGLHVHRLHPAPGREVDVGERGAVERGGGVHEHVTRPEPLDDPPHCLLVAEVNRELALAVEDRDLVPGRAERADDRATDSAGAAGHHRCPLQVRIAHAPRPHLWQTGHQYVVLPPTWSRSSRWPSRGHVPSRRRASMNLPVWAPPLRIAERTAARSSRRRRSRSSVERSDVLRRGEMRACQRIWSASRLPIPGDRALVEQPRLDRSVARADQAAEVVAADLGGVGSDVGEVRVEHGAPEPALVAEHEPAAVLELES